MDKYALITRASSGIGRKLYKLFSFEGGGFPKFFSVGENTRQNAQLGKVDETQLIAITKNLFDPTNAKDIYDEIKAQHLRIELLVNAARKGVYGEFTAAQLHQEMEIVRHNICSLVSIATLRANEQMVEI
ncbi:short-subunit dehydrogenase [Pedobacter sp. UYEF25]